MTPPPTPEALLAQAEACCQSGEMAQGLAAADQALLRLASDEQRARAAWLVGFFLFRLGRFGELLARREALGRWVELREGPDYFDHLRRVGLAGCEVGDFGVGMGCARELGALADAHDSPSLRAYALMSLAMCFERMGDPWQAERLMRDALALSREHGSERDRFLTLNNLSATLIGAFHLMRGEDIQAEARAALERALPLAREMQGFELVLAEPITRSIASGNLGEILLHLGQTDEARALLSLALDLACRFELTLQRQRIECSLTELALLQGDAAAALAQARRLLAEDGLLPQTALRAHHAAYEAARRLGDDSLALHHLERRTDLERRRAILQLRAQSDQFITRAEAEHARREAERLRERALAMEADALRDPLTGLGNRRELSLRLPAALQAGASAGQPLGLAMLDLDHFKRINDRFGHPVGDQVLVVTAQILRDNLRAHDLVARIGGEEFLVLLADAPARRVRQVCERIQHQVQTRDWGTLAHGLAVTVSVGYATAPPFDEHDLLARADAALYRAKEAGRNRVEAG
jgi:diguanylate cyclase (GGDEF)-like protein